VLSCLHNSLRSTFISLDAFSYIRSCGDAAAQRAFSGWDPLMEPVTRCLDWMGFGSSLDLTLIDHFGLGIEPLRHRLVIILLRQHKRVTHCNRSEGSVSTSSAASLLSFTTSACTACQLPMDLNLIPEEEAECRILLERVTALASDTPG
jgi:hypothetical protein